MEPNNTTDSYISLNQRLNQLPNPQSECTIYRVHRHLRDVNTKAYEPEVIAIGPYHLDKEHLKMMEAHKLRYLHLILQRRNETIETYISVIQPLEQEARKYYSEPISLSAAEFVDMLVLDGCFIVDLVRKYNMVHLRERNDSIFDMGWIISSLQRDLMLFENQIPYFILCKLFDLIEVPNQHARLMYLFLYFFNNLYPGKVNKNNNVNRSSNEISHLLHLIHSNWCESCPLDWLDFDEEANDEKKNWRFISSSSGLREANVKFEKNGGIGLFDMKFKDGILFLAPLTIEDRTESLLRNLIAYEQYFQNTRGNFVTDYVKFMDCLIDSGKDVEILSRSGIIDNWLGDNEVVANIFNKLMDSVAGPGEHFIYAKIFDNVSKHCNKRRNRWMAKLRRNYLSNPWAIISILVAAVLLLLTVTQTVFTVLQVV